MRIEIMKPFFRLFAIIAIFGSFTLASIASADPFYCPQNSQYINIGMSQSDVIQACGEPQNVKKSKKSAVKKVPVSQLTFNVSTQSIGLTAGTRTPGIQSGAFYANSGPLSTLVVTVSEDKITNISLNGASTQSASICGGSFAVGDPGSNAIASCGDPTAVNNTYKNVNTDKIDEVETWSYSPGNYQPSFQLTFVDGALSAIQK